MDNKINLKKIMKFMKQLSTYKTACVLLLLWNLSSGHAAKGGAEVLLHDIFIGEEKRGALVYTTAEVYSDELPGGLMKGPLEITEGAPQGNALQFLGLTQLIYFPVKKNIDITGGELSILVKFNFDPQSTNKDNIINNQHIFSIWDTSKGHTKAGVYWIRTGQFSIVIQEQGKIMLTKRFSKTISPDKWHRISLRWGDTIEIWFDSENEIKTPWEGLFGPIAVDLETTRIMFGTELGYSTIESQFSLADVTIKGPKPEVKENKAQQRTKVF